MGQSIKNLAPYLAIVLSSFLPTLASVPFPPWETGQVVREVLFTTSLAFSWLSPAIHISTVALLAILYWYGERIGRVADGYFGVLFLFFAFGQHIAVTEHYGLAVVTGNVAMILIVALYWFWETYKPQNEYVFYRLPAWRYWVVPFAILAFWFPVNADLTPSLSPLLLLTSLYGVAFCPTTPVVIAILTLIYPRVNKRLLTVTSLTGLIIGLFNVMSLFFMPSYTLWLLLLHTPLLFISLYGLILPHIVERPNLY